MWCGGCGQDCVAFYSFQSLPKFVFHLICTSELVDVRESFWTRGLRSVALAIWAELLEHTDEGIQHTLDYLSSDENTV